MTPGTSLSHYSIEAELGRGGMGIVFKARDTKLDRTVAIKVLPASALSSEDDRARFYREAKSAAALNHPHIAQVYQIDEAVPEGAPSDEVRPFIAMEFIDGRTLDAVIKAGPMALDEAVRIAIQVAQALEMAHENDIVHRDIKAANVMLTKKGDAKVLDFGLAKTAHSTMLTRMGSTLGTVAYMSPEQARGENVDHRTDLWALGVLLYELIAGRLPFAGDYEQAVTYSILNEDPHPLTALRTGVPMGLEWIVSKLMAKKADNRYQSAKDLIVDLKAVDTTQIGVTRTGMLSSAAMPLAAVPAKAPMWKSLIAPLMLVAGLGLGWLLFGLMGEPQTSAPLRQYTQYLDGMSDTRWPAISNSGRYLAIGGRDSLSNQPRLHLWDLQTNRRAAVPNSGFPDWPTFSPDETKVAFISGGKLKMASVDGSAPVDISNAASEMVVWGDDGTAYFMTQALQPARVLPDGKVETINVVQPEDRKVRNFFVNAVLDGHLLVVTNEDDGRTSAWKLDLSSGKVEMILEDFAWYLRYMDPGWLLVQTSQNGELLAYPFSREKLEVTGLPRSINELVSQWDWNVTKTGYFVSFRDSDSGFLQMVSLNDEGDLEPLISPLLDFEEFQFSPSGRSIVAEVNSYESGQDQILQFDLETGITRQITNTQGYFEPSLSPDGSRLVMASNGFSGQNVGIMRLDGVGGIEWITENAFISGDPDWSPSGELIAYDQGSQTTELDIWVHSLDEGKGRAVVEDPGSQTYPRFSHDSRYIAYESDQARSVQIWVVDLETGARTKVTSDPGFRPVWGPGDRSIYYSNGVHIYAIDVTTEGGFAVAGQPRLVVDVGARFYFDVSDQGRIAIAKQASKSTLSLEIIQNFQAILSGTE